MAGEIMVTWCGGHEMTWGQGVVGNLVYNISSLFGAEGKF